MLNELLDTARQRRSLKADTLIIRNQNETIIRQNEKIIYKVDRILRALSYLAQSNANDLSADKVSANFANMTKDIADGNK